MSRASDNRGYQAVLGGLCPVTVTSSTGADASSVGRTTYSLGGGAVTLTPGTSGRATLCTTSDSATFALVAENLPISYYQDPSAPISYSVANAISGTTTITCPATLGAKTAITNGNYGFWGMLVL